LPLACRSESINPTNYLYDSANAVTDLDANGAVLARYTEGSGVDEPLASLTGAGTAFFEADGLGSITSLSGATGVTDPSRMTSQTAGTPSRSDAAETDRPEARPCGRRSR